MSKHNEILIKLEYLPLRALERSSDSKRAGNSLTVSLNDILGEYSSKVLGISTSDKELGYHIEESANEEYFDSAMIGSTGPGCKTMQKVMKYFEQISRKESS